MITRKKLTLVIVTLVPLALGAGTVHAVNLFQNGGFESGNTLFSSTYSYSPTNYWPQGIYSVGTNPVLHHALWTSYSAHEGNYMMIVNGSIVPNVNVLALSPVTVAPNTRYSLSAWVASAYAGSPAILNFSINGQLVGVPFTASTTAGLWEQFYGVWDSGAATTATLSLVNQNTAFFGNDFTLDGFVLETMMPQDPGFVLETTKPQHPGPVPEPATMILLGSGLIGLAGYGRKKLLKK